MTPDDVLLGASVLTSTSAAFYVACARGWHTSLARFFSRTASALTPRRSKLWSPERLAEVEAEALEPVEALIARIEREVSPPSRPDLPDPYGRRAMRMGRRARSSPRVHQRASRETIARWDGTAVRHVRVEAPFVSPGKDP